MGNDDEEERRGAREPFTKSHQSSLTIAEKRALLRKHEMGRWTESGRAQKGIEPSDVTYLLSQSKEMKALLERQHKILGKEDGVADDEEED